MDNFKRKYDDHQKQYTKNDTRFMELVVGINDNWKLGALQSDAAMENLSSLIEEFEAVQTELVSEF